MVLLPVPQIEMRPTPLQGVGAGGSGHLMDKQSLVPAVQELWNAWEIHFMILLSLSLQVFLFLFADMRKRSSNWFLQTVLWLAYLSADSVAVFVLGHLAVRAREPSHELMSFWAPFVLVHLGGQDTITAFSKEDNELWRRHLLNLVIQVAVAGYVVAKASWPDARLRAAVVFMFLSGCFKYAERVICLYSASIGRLRRWGRHILSLKLEGRHHKRGIDKWIPISKLKATREEAEKYMRETLEMMLKGSSSERPNELFGGALTLVPDIISVDAPLNLTHNISVAAHHDLLPSMLKGFLSSGSRLSAYEHVGALLEYCYRQLYTKEPSPKFPGGWPALLLVLFITKTTTAISLTLFITAEKRDQLQVSSRVDITVTYLLLVGAIALEVSSTANIICRHLSFYLPCLAKPIRSLACCCSCTKQWSQELGQYNIISTARMWGISEFFGCDVKTTPITKDHTAIQEFILDTLLISGTREEWSIASTRGQLALHHKWTERHQHDDRVTTSTMESLKKTVRSSTDFPTSVLVLHIATDICYHYVGRTNSGDAAVKKHKQTSTELSNYIMYLVFKCGVMLTTISQIVHDHARKDIDNVLSQLPKVHPRNTDDAPVVMKLFEAIKKQLQEDTTGEIQIRDQETEEDSTIEIENEESTDIDDTAADDHVKKLKRSSKILKSPVLPRAIAVAQELISINDEAERWDLIAAVWAEMLYYTAPRCGGGFHYEHLSTGGEFVSHVLLLMYYLGPFLPPPPDA